MYMEVRIIIGNYSGLRRGGHVEKHLERGTGYIGEMRRCLLA